MNYAAQLSAARCKLCLAPAFQRYTLPRFDLLECSDCGFHFIDYLDPAGYEADGPVRDLAHNQERIAANVALLRRHAPPGPVLDIGCGAGEFLERVGGQGVEPDGRYRALAEARGLSVTTSWPSGKFAAVTLWDVIEHVNDPVEIVASAYKRLQPGGVMLLDTPNREGTLYRAGEALARVTGGKRGGTMAMQYAPDPFCHKQIFRERDIRRLLNRFNQVTIEQRTELSFPAEFYLRNFIRSAPARSAIGRGVGALLRVLPLRNKLIVVAVKRAH